MRLRGLLIALVVLAALAGGVYWSERAEKAKEGKPAPDAPPEILKIPEAQFQRIEIRKAGAEPILLQKSVSGKWEMLSGPKWPVDQDAAGGVVNTLASLTSSRLAEEKPADLAQFGLAAPSLEVTFGLKDGKTRKLLFGDDSPAGGGSFVKLDGEPRVFTVAAYSKTGVDKSPRDLRDKRLLTFESEKLTRVELTAKGQSVEFGKNARNEWQIIRPWPVRADGGAVEDLIRKLSDAKMDATTTPEEDKKASAAFAGAVLVGVARVTDASGTQQIEVRRDAEKNCYARSSVVEGAYKTASDLADSMDKGMNDFRNKKLFDFGFSDPSSVEVRDGDKQASYQKRTDKWMSGSAQMDATTVNALIDKLRDLSAIKFLSGVVPTPTFEAKVTWNGGKSSEKVQISKQGNSCLAKREGEPSIYEVDPKACEEIQKAFAAIKAYTPPAAKKK